MGVLCQLYTKFDSTASSASSWASSSHSTTSFASWASSSDSTATFSPLRQVDPGLCALKMAATCSRFFARVVLKIPFSSSHSKGSRCKCLVSFLAKSALMLSTGVTLSFSYSAVIKKLYASKEVKENALASEGKSCRPENNNYSQSICMSWPLSVKHAAKITFAQYKCRTFQSII